MWSRGVGAAIALATPYSVAYYEDLLRTQTVTSAYVGLPDSLQDDYFLDRRRLADAKDVTPLVNGTFFCTFITGQCFTHEASHEGMPLDQDKCVSEQRLGPLKLAQEVDLDCLKSEVTCQHSFIGKEFDPFYTCDQDPNLLDVRCSLDCHTNPHKGIPTVYQTCIYDFDKSGKYKMSFDEIAVCRLDGECQSQYVEKNVLHCYNESAGRTHHPWEVTKWASTGRENKPGFKPRPAFVRGKMEHRGRSMMEWFAIFSVSSMAILIMVKLCFSKGSSPYSGMGMD
jgi:hypothetical protein